MKYSKLDSLIRDYIYQGDISIDNAADLALEYSKELSKAYARWLNDNFWTPWNENEWYSEYEMNHIRDEELFNKFLEEYENYTCHR